MDLDSAEGLGNGYRWRPVVTADRDGRPWPAGTYLPTRSFLDPTLRPYDWYLDLVIAGARKHALPPEYRSFLSGFESLPDRDRERASTERAFLSGR